MHKNSSITVDLHVACINMCIYMWQYISYLMSYENTWGMNSVTLSQMVLGFVSGHCHVSVSCHVLPWFVMSNLPCTPLFMCLVLIGSLFCSQVSLVLSLALCIFKPSCLPCTTVGEVMVFVLFYVKPLFLVY